MPRQFICAGQVLTEELRATLDLYANEGYPTGGFLRACLANDFLMAVGRADDNNIHLLAVIASYIYNEMPRDSHGSYEIVDRWIEFKDAKRRKMERDVSAAGTGEWPPACNLVQ
jgi:hypothetical protein